MAETIVALPAIPPALSPPTGPLSTGPLTEAALGHLLGTLASRPGPVPKYVYPSAGTLYPVQAYVVLRRPLGQIDPGCYYHHPDEHALVLLSTATPGAPDGSWPDALLLLAAHTAAIAPIYAAEAERFCLLEAGYMAEALHSAGLALRDAGDPITHPALASGCHLETEHMPLICWAIGEDA
jgi:hypothetical protein